MYCVKCTDLYEPVTFEPRDGYQFQTKDTCTTVKSANIVFPRRYCNCNPSFQMVVRLTMDEKGEPIIQPTYSTVREWTREMQPKTIVDRTRMINLMYNQMTQAFADLVWINDEGKRQIDYDQKWTDEKIRNFSWEYQTFIILGYQPGTSSWSERLKVGFQRLFDPTLQVARQEAERMRAEQRSSKVSQRKRKHKRRA